MPTHISRPPAWWRRVSAIVDELRVVGPGAREPILARGCSTNDELRREAEGWLAAMEAEGSSLVDLPVHESVPHLISELAAAHLPPDASLPDRAIGPWRLVEEIGCGGSGVVWRAVRADGAYDQTVAIKLLWGRTRTSELERRFEAERRILASLEHPNIARLIDGGIAGGTPFLVMEHVDGRPITDWCSIHCPSLEKLLDLFASVCDAVGHAHRNLVVHRDLKPSNILVTEDGFPKVVDFGVAKLLAEPGRETALETGIPMWTPAYAAPEQIRGEPVTTATDVWGLGAVLYRLLTGAEVRTVDSFTPAALERAARAEPRRPSSSADVDTAGVPARRIAGDLDAIVRTALCIEPEKRYANGTEFSADLRRHATGLPVMARPPTVWYRLQKLVARNRIPVAAGAAFVVLATAYAVALGLQADRLATARDRARFEAGQADAAVDFVGELLWAAGPFVGAGIERPRDLVDLAIVRTDSAFSGTPRIRAEILTSLGKSAYWIGELDEARNLFERAVAISGSATVDEVDPETAWRALHYLGSTRHQFAEYEGAEAAFVRALETYGPILGPRDEHVASTRNALGWLYHETGDLDRAEANYRMALEIRREVLGPGSVQYATTLENLGLLFADRGEYDASEPLVRAALQIRRRAYGPWHVNTAYAFRSLGRILYRQGRTVEAEALLRTTVEMRRRLLGATHHKYAEDIAALASVLAARGELTEAQSLLEEALAIRRESLGEDNPVTAVTRHHLGTVHHRLGDPSAADALYRSALGSLTERFGTAHPWTAGLRVDLDRLESGRTPVERDWLSGTRLVLPRRVDVDTLRFAA